MKVVLTKRAQKRIESNRLYLENEFCPEYSVTDTAHLP